MKVVGIVAEYNPFHNGHAYQIEYARKTLGADYIIVVMSGPFTQRGLPAIFDKYSRAEAAVRCGVDMVLELPVIYATASAEIFAYGAVSVLEATGIVDTILFGCETPDMNKISQAASVLIEEPAEYRATLQQFLTEGNSFAKARSLAMEAYGLSEIMNDPNNILAIEYVKALKKLGSNITPVCMQRVGATYHEADITQTNASATAIRSNILSNDNQAYLSQIPEQVKSQYQNLVQSNQFISPDDISSVLHYALLSENNYECYTDCSTDLSNKITKNLSSYQRFGSFCHALKSKEITHSRITRVMSHILLHIKDDDFQKIICTPKAHYLRVLCANNASVVLFSEIKKRGHAPIITSPKDISMLTSTDGQNMLSLDTYAADIYRSTLTAKSHQTYPTEFTRKFSLLS